MKISLIVDCWQIENPDALLPQVTRLLRAWGSSVKLIVPDACYLNLAHIQPTSDLYLLTANTPLALTLAGVLHALGATVINPYPVASALYNKLIGLRILQAHELSELALHCGQAFDIDLFRIKVVEHEGVP